MEHILLWEPTEKQWWIIGFAPEHMFNVAVHKKVMIGCVDFSQYGSIANSNEMYSNFKKETLKDDTKSRFVIFDDDNLVVWIMWYRRTI